jgi:hypothetical protein
MRTVRTAAENRVLERLPPALAAQGIELPVIDRDVTDAPDVLVHHARGRLGLEISRLDYEAYCKWLATPPGSVYSRAAEITINLRKLLAAAVRKKRRKYDAYVQNHSLSECWLVLHNNVFEFPEVGEAGRADRRWFEMHSSWELQEQQCPFDRVLFNLEHPDRWYTLYRKGTTLPRQSIITRWPSIVFKEAAIVPAPGVNMLDLQDKPNRPTFR